MKKMQNERKPYHTPSCRSCFQFDTAHATREDRILYVERIENQPALLHSPDDNPAVKGRLERLKQSGLQEKLLVQQVNDAMKKLWQSSNAEKVVIDYLNNPKTDITKLIAASKMTDNQELANSIKGGGQQYLRVAMPLFRSQFVGKIEGVIKERHKVATNNDKIEIQTNGSQLLLQLLAAESSAGDTPADSLLQAMHSLASIPYLKNSGVAAKFQNKNERGKIAEEMNRGFSLSTIKGDGSYEAARGEVYQFEQAHVLTGAVMMTVDPKLLGGFKLKNVIFQKWGNSFIVLARMENGCQGNFFSGVIKKVEKKEEQAQVPKDTKEEPKAESNPTDEGAPTESPDSRAEQRELKARIDLLWKKIDPKIAYIKQQFDKFPNLAWKELYKTANKLRDDAILLRRTPFEEHNLPTISQSFNQLTGRFNTLENDVNNASEKHDNLSIREMLKIEYEKLKRRWGQGLQLEDE